MRKSVLALTALTALIFTDFSYSATFASRRNAAQNRINKLIASTNKASADLNREVRRLESGKEKRIKGSDLKAARSLAAKLNRYVRFLEQRRNSLGKSEGDLKRDIKKISDATQKLQFELQDVMNRYQRAYRVLSNILKRYSSTASGIVRNIK